MFPHLSRVAVAPVLNDVHLTGPAQPPREPWLTAENLGAAPRPMEEIAFDRFDSAANPPAHDAIRRWFTPLAGGHIEMRDFFGAGFRRSMAGYA